MSYLDPKSITVQAVLTKKGRELLALKGGLNITAFALADDEIDYGAYQPSHPLGSAYYDLAIRSTPVMEPFTDETQVMKHKLVTLPAGTTVIPTITLGQSSIYVNKQYTGEIIINPSTTPAYNTKLGYTAILGNKNIGTLIGENLPSPIVPTIPSFFGDISSTTAQVAVGTRFKFVPNNALTSTITTQLIVIGNESGGSVSIPVTVTVTTT